MLVLTLKIDQSAVIGDSEHFENVLKVHVLQIGDGSVRLGFEADEHIPIHRAEVLERIKRNGRTQLPLDVDVEPKPKP